ncbi:MAG TPA: RDD family protein, partial [Vicinamibacterales bacterium]|nr:RDD family protein [Vicinamibacterales bacterium]
LDTSHAEEPEMEPLVKVPARPRTPVSVRRTTPDPARLRAKYGMSPSPSPSPSPEPDLWSNMPADPIDQVDMREEVADFQDLPLTSSPAASWQSEPTPERLPAGWQEPVGAGARLFAAFIDVTLLGGLSAAVIYFTLAVTGLSTTQIGLLPALPLGGLLLMMIVGYLLMFTMASGQSVGKMVMRIRVVGTSPEAVINDRITVSQAAVRSLVALPSVLVFGLGFLPALGGAGLALHDRIAHTRVVRL